MRRPGGPAGAVRVREGRPEDAARLAAVMRAAVRGLPPGACTPRQRAAWSSLPALYHRWAMSAGGEGYLVAERGGRPVGFAAWRLHPGRSRRGEAPPEAELTSLFVHPSAGGAGIGSSLVAAVDRRARRAGAAVLRVLAARPAVGFYAALGFEGSRWVRLPLPGGARLPALWMRRRIAPRGGATTRAASSGVGLKAPAG